MQDMAVREWLEVTSVLICRVGCIAAARRQTTASACAGRVSADWISSVGDGRLSLVRSTTRFIDVFGVLRS